MKRVFHRLTPDQLDALREIANIGMGHAATALSQMIDRKVELKVPRVSVAPLSEVPDIIGGAEKLVVGVYLKIFGDARGNILLIFPRSSAANLINILLPGGEPPRKGFLEERSASALKEIGNILAASFLNAVSSLLNLTLIPSVPSIAFDMVGAIIDYTLTELGQAGDITLIIETELIGELGMSGRFFVLPDPRSLDVVLKAGKVG